MKPIEDPAKVIELENLVKDMMVLKDGSECEFDSRWIQSHHWKVVPKETMSRIPVPDIPGIVNALNAAGYDKAFAIFNEPGYIQSLSVSIWNDPSSDTFTCYEVPLSRGGLEDLNRQLGLFRFILFPENRAWAISCNEWYNLFGAEPDLLEQLLGKSIEEARQEYDEFAALMARGTDEPLVKMAQRYAAL